MKIMFIRHGQSQANVGLVSSDEAYNQYNNLTNKGRMQIAELARNFDRKVEVVYASPMLRTQESAQEFINIRAIKKPILIDDRLREIDYGIYRADKKNPEMVKIAQKQINGDYEIRFGGGENKREILERFFSFIVDCYDKHPDLNITVFTHGRAISIVEAELNRLNQLHKQHVHSGNGVVKEFEIGVEEIKRIKNRFVKLKGKEL